MCRSKKLNDLLMSTRIKVLNYNVDLYLIMLSFVNRREFKKKNLELKNVFRVFILFFLCSIG